MPADPGRPTVVVPGATSPAIAKVIASRWSSRLSVAAPRRPAPAVDAQVVAVDVEPRAERGQAGRDAGDAVRFLVAQLAGAADRRRAIGHGRREAQDRDLVDGRRDVVAAEVDPAQIGRSHDQVADRLADPVVGVARPCRRPAVPRCRRPSRRSRSMTARRVGLTPTSWRVELGVRMDRAGDQPEGGRGHVARHPLVHRLHARSLLAPTRSPRPSASAALHRHPSCPEHPLRVVARRDRFADRRPTVRPKARQQDRRLHLGARDRRGVVDGRERGVDR